MRHIQPTRHAEIKRRPPPFVAPPRTTLPGDGRDLVAASAIPISYAVFCLKKKNSRRKQQYQGFILFGDAEDHVVEARQSILEHRATTQDAVDASGNDQAVPDQAVMESNGIVCGGGHLSRP